MKKEDYDAMMERARNARDKNVTDAIKKRDERAQSRAKYNQSHPKESRTKNTHKGWFGK